LPDLLLLSLDCDAALLPVIKGNHIVEFDPVETMSPDALDSVLFVLRGAHLSPKKAHYIVVDLAAAETCRYGELYGRCSQRGVSSA
jgi:hypothetical protein